MGGGRADFPARPILETPMPQFYDITHNTPIRRMPLHMAALRRDMPGLVAALNAGIFPDTRMTQRLTALHLAVMAGWGAGVDRLLSAGANPQKADGTGRSALHHAVSAGHANLLRGCLAAGGEPEGASDRPVLHLAALLGEVEAMAVLLAHGYDPDACDRDRRGYTALHAAVEGGFPEAVSRLLAAGASPDGVECDECDRTPLRLAVEERPHLIPLLVRGGANKEARDEEGLTPWLAAARSGNKVAMRMLAGLGADVNAVDGEWRSALAYAACSGAGAPADVEFVVSLGTDLGLRDECGGTVLHRAAGLDDVALFTRLQRLGADFFAADDLGRIPVDLAPQGGKLLGWLMRGEVA